MFKVFPSMMKKVEGMLVDYERLNQLQANLVIGTKQVIKAISNGQVKEVVIAKDAEQHIIKEIRNSVNEFKVPYTYVDSKKKLGKACNIEVGATVIAIKDKS